MDWSNLAGLVLAAVVTAAIPILLPPAITLISTKIHNERLARLAEVVARGAGRIALEVAQARASRPGVPMSAIIAEQMTKEQSAVMAAVPDTIAKLGASTAIVGQMLQGELGKLLAPAPAVAIDRRPGA